MKTWRSDVHDKRISLQEQHLDHSWSNRAADGGTAVPSSVSTHRAAVRTKANAMCTQIDNASDVDALAALYVYNDAETPVRPLGEWPTL